MRIIRISYKDPHELDDPMGHVTIPEILDYIKGFISGYRKTEIKKHFEECPRCEDNYLTILDNSKEPKSF